MELFRNNKSNKDKSKKPIFGCKKSVSKKGHFDYDRENLLPVVHISICTGEKVAGFKDIHTGKFTDIMLIRGDGDLQEFLSMYGISEEELGKDW